MRWHKSGHLQIAKSDFRRFKRAVREESGIPIWALHELDTETAFNSLRIAFTSMCLHSNNVTFEPEKNLNGTPKFSISMNRKLDGEEAFTGMVQRFADQTFDWLEEDHFEDRRDIVLDVARRPGLRDRLLGREALPQSITIIPFRPEDSVPPLPTSDINS